MTTLPQEFLKCSRCATELIWMNGTMLKKANYQISTTLELICTPTSVKQSLGDQEWLSWALGHDGEPLVLTLRTNSQPSPPCSWQTWDGGAQRGFGEHLGMLSWRKHNPFTEREVGKSIRTPTSRGITALPFCSTRTGWKPSESGSNFTWIRMICFSPACDEFDLTLYADKSDLKQLYLESRFHCRHSCCMTDATVLSQHCFQCLQQLHSIPLPDIKGTFILINGKKINLWGK